MAHFSVCRLSPIEPIRSQNMTIVNTYCNRRGTLNYSDTFHISTAIEMIRDGIAAWCHLLCYFHKKSPKRL